MTATLRRATRVDEAGCGRPPSVSEEEMKACIVEAALQQGRPTTITTTACPYCGDGPVRALPAILDCALHVNDVTGATFYWRTTINMCECGRLWGTTVPIVVMDHGRYA